ncbi:MAG: hypothetical protein R6X25_03005 [Candidatus Krumholzibacteriia bacterium]
MSRPSRSFYCYLHTTDADVARKAGTLGLHELDVDEVPGARTMFLSSIASAEPVYCSVINDLADWTLPSFRSPLAGRPLANADSGSLISCARVEAGSFGCCTDYWGLRTHYWHQSAGTFACSNNLFLLAHLIDASLDEAGVDEILFFLTTMGSRTAFAGIDRLQAGQHLRFDVGTANLELSVPGSPGRDLLETPAEQADYVTSFLDFFEQAAGVMGNRTAAVCASAGTDSNTVIACLRRAGCGIATFSFGQPHYYESRWTRAHSARLGIPFTLVPLPSADEWQATVRDTTFWSNGLINPYRIHYQKLYDTISEEYAVFEGTLGSQFVKGDLPIGSTISDCHAHALRNGGSPGPAIEHHLGALPREIRERIAATVARDHGACFVDISSEEGGQALRSFALTTLPQNMFAGPLLLAADGHQLYLPYLDRHFLSSLLHSGAPGFARQTALQGPIELAVKMRTQAAIVARADPWIERRVLGHGISFREARTLPTSWCRGLRWARRQYRRRWRHRDAFFSQIDNSTATAAVTAALAETPAPWGRWEVENASPRLRMSAANLLLMERIRADLNDGWRPWSESLAVSESSAGRPLSGRAS